MARVERKEEEKESDLFQHLLARFKFFLPQNELHEFEFEVATEVNGCQAVNGKGSAWSQHKTNPCPMQPLVI